MNLITKLLHISALNTETNQKVERVMFLKMPDRNNGKDDLSMHPDDLQCLKENICSPFELLSASVICTQYTDSLIPKEYQFLT